MTIAEKNRRKKDVETLSRLLRGFHGEPTTSTKLSEAEGEPTSNKSCGRKNNDEGCCCNDAYHSVILVDAHSVPSQYISSIRRILRADTVSDNDQQVATSTGGGALLRGELWMPGLTRMQEALSAVRSSANCSPQHRNPATVIQLLSDLLDGAAALEDTVEEHRDNKQHHQDPNHNLFAQRQTTTKEQNQNTIGRSTCGMLGLLFTNESDFRHLSCILDAATVYGPLLPGRVATGDVIRPAGDLPLGFHMHQRVKLTKLGGDVSKSGRLLRDLHLVSKGSVITPAQAEAATLLRTKVPLPRLKCLSAVQLPTKIGDLPPRLVPNEELELLSSLNVESEFLSGLHTVDVLSVATGVPTSDVSFNQLMFNGLDDILCLAVGIGKEASSSDVNVVPPTTTGEHHPSSEKSPHWKALSLKQQRRQEARMQDVREKKIRSALGRAVDARVLSYLHGEVVKIVAKHMASMYPFSEVEMQQAAPYLIYECTLRWSYDMEYTRRARLLQVYRRELHECDSRGERCVTLGTLFD